MRIIMFIALVVGIVGAQSLLAAESKVVAAAQKTAQQAATELKAQRVQQLQKHRELLQQLRSVQAAHAKQHRETARLRRAVVDAQRDRHRRERELRQARQYLQTDVSAIRQILAWQSPVPVTGNLSFTELANLDLENLIANKAAVESAAAYRLSVLPLLVQPSVQTETIIDKQGSQITAKVLTVGPTRYALSDTIEKSGWLIPVDQAQGAWRLADTQPTVTRRGAWPAQATPGPALLTFDVTGDLATKAPSQAWTLGSYFKQGGPFVWPIIVIALIAAILIAERAYALLRLRSPLALAERVLTAVRQHNISDAMALVQDRRIPMARILYAPLHHWQDGHEAREAAATSALIQEEQQLGRSLRILAALAGAAPLLGLLGTVSGMIATFAVIGDHGTGDPRLIGGGISQALITTQLGLIVAVPVLIMHAWLARMCERRLSMLEQAASALLAGEVDKANGTQSAQEPQASASQSADGPESVPVT